MNILLRTIKNHWVSLLLVTSALVGISVAYTAFKPFEYRSGFSVLVMEKTDAGDAFAAAKSAERASLSLGQILYTTSFFDEVRESGLLENDMFSSDELERRKMWEAKLETRIFPDTGIMKIAAYDEHRERATTLAVAVATTLTKNGPEYLGSGKNIVLKVVDAPLTSKQPVRPNIPLNIALAVLLGFGGTLAIHLLRESQRHVGAHAQTAVATQNVAIPAPVRAEPETPAPWQPPVPVVTTMYSPEAIARMRTPEIPPTPQPQRDSWEMPDIRRGNDW
jgi:capsular polysaccharide biosynthesis protein